MHELITAAPVSLKENSDIVYVVNEKKQWILIKTIISEIIVPYRYLFILYKLHM